MNISDLSGCNLVGLASSISILLSENLSANDLSILSAFVSALGDNLAILSATKSMEESNDDNNKK